jgi:hypothetical protein
LIDIKVTDSAGPSALSRLHTDRVRLAAHSQIVRQSAVDYWGVSRTPPSRSRMRLVTFVVSTFAALGPDAQALLAAVDRYCGSTLPASLRDEATWAAPCLTVFARQAVTLELRRSLASALRDSFSDSERAGCFVPAAPPADPPPVGPDHVFDPPCS